METELSNALAAWASDPSEMPFEGQTLVLGLSMSHNITPRGGHESQDGERGAAGVIFFCRYSQAEVLAKYEPAERRMVVEGLCFRSYLPEL